MVSTSPSVQTAAGFVYDQLRKKIFEKTKKRKQSQKKKIKIKFFFKKKKKKI